MLITKKALKCISIKASEKCYKWHDAHVINLKFYICFAIFQPMKDIFDRAPIFNCINLYSVAEWK